MAKQFILQMPNGFEDYGKDTDDYSKLFKIVHFDDLINSLTNIIKKGYISVRYLFSSSLITANSQLKLPTY